MSHPAPPIPDFDPLSLDNDTLEDAITTLSASIAVATWRLLRLIAELDRRELCGMWGVKSTAHWLNWKCGLDMGAAREKVRVARALEGLPRIDAAFARGELSYSKVRAITRVGAPENEEFLLMIARHGTAMHLERLVRAYRRVQRIEASEHAEKLHAGRELRWHIDEDGCYVIEARLPAEQGALLLKALEAAADEDARGATTAESVSAETRETPPPESERPALPARRADALCRIAEAYLTGDSTTARQADRYQVTVHVARESLCEEGDSGRCEIDHGPALAPETARRLACDAALVEIEEDERGNVLDIGRRSRSIPPALRRALENRDRGCRFPGCTHHRFVDGHHIRHWADGGETSLDNLVLLCRAHHRLVHEGGFTLARRDDGKLLFLRPDGRPVPDVVVPPEALPIEQIVLAAGADVSAETCVPRWDGHSMDLELAVDALVDKRDRARLDRPRFGD